MRIKERRVEVTWNDACQLGGTWHERSEATSKEGRSPARVTSTGYLIHADKRVLVMATDIHGSKVGGVSVIPRGNVVKLRGLR
jgi:hypothetical protein